MFLGLWLRNIGIIKYLRRMIYFFCFVAKNNIMSLSSRVWIKVYFPLKGPVVHDFQIFIEIISRCLIVMYNRKQRGIICKQLYIGSKTFCKIINVNQKQQRTKNGTLRYFIIDIFHLETWPLRATRCFLYFKKNPPEGSVNFPIFHFELVCRWYHNATSY